METLFDMEMEYAECCFEKDILGVCLESVYIESEGTVENKIARAGKALGDFVDRVITALKKWFEETKQKIKTKILEVIAKAKKDKVAWLAKRGKTVKFYDVWRAEKVMAKAYKFFDGALTKWIATVNKKSCTLATAQAYLLRYNKTMDTLKKELDDIYKEKQDFPADKVFDWMEKNLNSTGGMCGQLASYINRLESIESTMNRTISDLSKKADAQGYALYPDTFKSMLGNSVTFCKHNWSLVLGACIMAAGTATYKVNHGKQQKAYDEKNKIPEEDWEKRNDKTLEGWDYGNKAELGLIGGIMGSALGSKGVYDTYTKARQGGYKL